MNSSIQFANVALFIGLIIIVIASFRWKVGIVASVLAALLLNYFGTEPIHSLRVTSGDDLLTITLLMSLGIVVSVITRYRVQQTVLHSHSVSSEELTNNLRKQLENFTPASTVWSSTFAALDHELDLLDVRLNQELSLDLPVVSYQPGMGVGNSKELLVPASGAIVAFSDPRLAMNIVITPRPGMGPLMLRRDVLFMFARHVEVVLTGTL